MIMGERITEDGRIEMDTGVPYLEPKPEFGERKKNVAWSIMRVFKLEQERDEWRDKYFVMLRKSQVYWLWSMLIAVAASLYAGWFLWGAG